MFKSWCSHSLLNQPIFWAINLASQTAFSPFDIGVNVSAGLSCIYRKRRIVANRRKIRERDELCAARAICYPPSELQPLSVFRGQVMLSMPWTATVSLFCHRVRSANKCVQCEFNSHFVKKITELKLSMRLRVLNSQNFAMEQSHLWFLLFTV